MKTYQIYFLVYAFLGVILISVATLATGIAGSSVVRLPIDAHDVYKLGCWFLGISTFLIVFDCLRLALKENRRVLNQK
jgi:membrane protein DedA with SNARE-associated domain